MISLEWSELRFADAEILQDILRRWRILDGGRLLEQYAGQQQRIECEWLDDHGVVFYV